MPLSAQHDRVAELKRQLDGLDGPVADLRSESGTGSPPRRPARTAGLVVPAQTPGSLACPGPPGGQHGGPAPALSL